MSPTQDPDAILVRGARQHNLRDVHVRIPRGRLVVVTGPSGSGKSSLAFDTVYAEGQRRYVESLSPRARQFLERLPKPDVDTIEGLSPAISARQQSASSNPRSTVGTLTEIHDYLRVLYARVGRATCPRCGRALVARTIEQMVEHVLQLPESTRFAVLAPLVRGVSGDHADVLERLRREGFVRARIDGDMWELGDEIPLDPELPHTVEVYVDRLSVKSGVRQRLTEAVEVASSMAEGLVRIAPVGAGEELLSERLACPECGITLPEITPQTFSFNSPAGACPECDGLGERRELEEARVVPDPTRSIAEGAIAPWGKPGGAYYRRMCAELEKRLPQVDVHTTWSSLPERARRCVLDGTTATGGEKAFEGVLPGLRRRLRDYERRRRDEGGDEQETFEALEEELGRFAVRRVCAACGGARLKPEALAVRVGEHSIDELSRLPVREVARVLERLDLGAEAAAVAERVVGEIDTRIRFLVDVGLDYLSLDRAAASLSGGEAERIRLATQIGAGLVGVLYVLDEPSVGLHPRDVGRLVRTLESLRDRGNTVLMVEHDAEGIRRGDHVIDMGPGAGAEGGAVVATGTVTELESHPESLTGAYLAGRRRVPVPAHRRPGTQRIAIRKARVHNLRHVNVDLPLDTLCCVTGVSGSGKSSLVMDTLVPAVRRVLHDSNDAEVAATVEGIDHVDRMVAVDQTPIGRTPRSSPASYTGILGYLREWFAQLPEARSRGYKPGRFSFNVKGGRCETCQGAGSIRMEMHFLPDVYVECEDCGGRRYNRETLEVRYRGYNIADVLEMKVEEARPFFEHDAKLRERLEALYAVGLGYLELGRSATTLSAGEAQRVKLARELSRGANNRTLYVLDEPTSGLHFADIEVLVHALNELVRTGHSVVVVEHDVDVIKVADYVVDLGPEGGERGGTVVAEGTPEELAAADASHTGRYLRDALWRGRINGHAAASEFQDDDTA